MSWFRRLWNRLCAWLARHGLLPRSGIFYIGDIRFGKGFNGGVLGE